MTTNRRWTAALTALGLLACASSPSVLAQEASPQVREHSDVQEQNQEQIYGSQLMTAQERAAFRTRIRHADTDAERAQIRAEHRKQMEIREGERSARDSAQSKTRESAEQRSQNRQRLERSGPSNPGSRGSSQSHNRGPGSGPGR